MKIETKFDLGQPVILIRNEREKVWITCAACKGVGKVTLGDGKQHSCPKCYGHRGKNEWLPTKWLVTQALTIGEIQYRERMEWREGDDSEFANYRHQDAKVEERYMCRETGIGTGSCWSAEDMFATREEAEAECLRRNEADTALAAAEETK